MTQKLITDYFKISNKKRKITEIEAKIEAEIEIKSWYCITCGIDMGIHNPRQLCGKYCCINFF